MSPHTGSVFSALVGPFLRGGHCSRGVIQRSVAVRVEKTNIIRERTKAGLTAARARARQGGRPKGLSKEAHSKAQAAKTRYLQQDKTGTEIGQLLGVGRAVAFTQVHRSQVQ